MTEENPDFAITEGTEGLSEIKTVHYYKVPATEYFLDIKHGTVVADKLVQNEGDETKQICKILRYGMDSGQLQFKAALYSETTSKYIVIGQDNQILLDDNPMWFEAVTYTCFIMFKKNDMYLAYDNETRQIVAANSEFKFEELPVVTAADESGN
ncbi:uncharacterized protein LOC123554204 [Mercenaria mercenaria]|uniref:uncharacterized protein LOC123554204 n=1 Tax=Mercenaria mercenaria TaxID=6596 RepID=UPI00234ED08C|nr:uncharacterized protein LOC123554204 [Mercenaria mercenaria]